MIRQKSFEKEQPTLYLVPTPIGNLQEMTPRALEVLKTVDCIAAEDTRNTHRLLQSYDIHTPMISHHEHNQEKSVLQILERLSSGQSIAVVSDAGYPLVSDPGQRLVTQTIEAGYPVVSVSGANAAMNALVASGLSVQHYLFYGFLENKHSKRIKELETLKRIPYTLIFYEAPHRIEAMLEDVLEVFGDRRMCLARELTKLHEEYIRGTVSEILSVVSTCKGEMVVVLEGNQEKEELDTDALIQEVLELTQTMRLKEAAKIVADKYHCSKNELYQEALKRK